MNGDETALRSWLETLDGVLRLIEAIQAQSLPRFMRAARQRAGLPVGYSREAHDELQNAFEQAPFEVQPGTRRRLREAAARLGTVTRGEPSSLSVHRALRELFEAIRCGNAVERRALAWNDQWEPLALRERAVDEIAAVFGERDSPDESIENAKRLLTRSEAAVVDALHERLGKWVSFRVLRSADGAFRPGVTDRAVALKLNRVEEKLFPTNWQVDVEPARKEGRLRIVERRRAQR